MPESEYVLPAPTSVPDLVALAESTEEALSILRPWCTVTKHYKSKALVSIQIQALSYVEAIDFSITAAQDGYTIADEVLDFAEDISVGKNTPEKELQEYLQGMLQLAQRGEENAKLAWTRFREVRNTVERVRLIPLWVSEYNWNLNWSSTQLVREAKEERIQENKKLFAFLRGRLGHLEENIAVLERFSKAISLYMAWWNELNMTHGAITSRTTKINYSSLRNEAVVKSWRTLKTAYVDYTNKIKAIQDVDPTFASQLEMPCNDEPERGAGVSVAVKNEPKKKKRHAFKRFWS
ncbi:hypothetical protein D9613_011547 [Agrocybe pediades]|uniref:Uncharacterized protein n=1 Tax=Agrocybe pediades TaxID=84607 RepID=A0A8H4QVI9_9AGAR|nr:hypothetical protein D9613_011547 [Agrocybe pediades]